MFESAELGHEVDEKTYDAEVPALRQRLLRAQADVFRKKAFPVIVIISGVEAAGKGDTLHTLHEWMDTRHIETHAFDRPDCVERGHPEMWRFWQALPRVGGVGIFLGGWYRNALYARVYEGEKRGELERQLEQTVRFEQMLADEGALIVKYWLHLPKKTQRKKLEELDSDRRTRWRVRSTDWRNHEHYAEFRKTAEEMLRRTSSRASPWIVVEGTDARYRRLTVARTLCDAMHARLAQPAAPKAPAAPVVPAVDNRKLLRDLDLTKSLAKDEYDKRLAKAQGALASLSRVATKRKRGVVIAFEGSDAAGKGGAIRRLTAALDARHYRVTATAAPSEEERAHPISGASGARFHAEGRSRSSTAPGTDGSSSSGSRSSAPSRSGCAPTRRSTTSRRSSRRTGSSSSSSGSRSRRPSSCGDSVRARTRGTSASSSRARTGAIEEVGRLRAGHLRHVRSDQHSTAPWTLVEANDKPYARVKVLETVVARLRDEL